MNNEFITNSALQTKKLGQLLAEELCGGPASTRGNDHSSMRGGEIICLAGDLGAGKTTFTQGLLKGLKIKGPYTSPTFAILKQYKVSSRKYNAESIIPNTKYIIHDVYHIDAYRINSKDLLELGFKDFAGKESSITIIEWPEKVKRLIPTTALWINFQWLSDKERKITLSTKKEL